MEVSEEMKLIKRGTAEIISEEELRKKLIESKKTKIPLRVKQGFEPRHIKNKCLKYCTLKKQLLNSIVIGWENSHLKK